MGLCRHFQYFPSIQFWHDQIGNDEVKVLHLGCLDGFLPILNGNNLIPLLRKGLSKGPPDQVFIISNQDLARLNGRSPLSPRYFKERRTMATKYVRVLRSLNLPIPGYDAYIAGSFKQLLKNFSFPRDCHCCTSKTYTLSKHLFTDLQKQSNRLNRLLNYFFLFYLKSEGRFCPAKLCHFPQLSE